MSTAKDIICPVCKISFELEDDLDLGDSISCPSCDVDLRIVSLDPAVVEEKRQTDDDFDDFEETSFE